MSRIEELEAMRRFADEILEEYKQNNEEVPKFVYDKVVSIYTELIELIRADTKRLKAITEAAKAANRVFESGRSLI